MSSTTATAAPRFTFERHTGSAFDPVPIRLMGVTPGQMVRIVTSCIDSNGVRFRSWGEYRADEQGTIVPARQIPLAGSYTDADAFGLWWSMESEEALPFCSDLRPLVTAVEAEAAGRVVAQCSLIRRMLTPGLSAARIRSPQVKATLVKPTSGAEAGVLVLGGSEGGRRYAEDLAAFLAGHGFAALAVTYFGEDGHERTLEGIPLERVAAAATWLLERTERRLGRVGIVGASRGAELALLAASYWPTISAVVALSPSNVVWPGVTNEFETPRPAWTFGGIPLPFAEPALGRLRHVSSDAPVEFASVCQDTLRNRPIGQAKIPVERIKGAVLLISGGDDRVWPSTEMGDAIMLQLAKSAHPFDHQHLVFDGAGHGVARLPGLPAPPTTTVTPGNTGRIVLGGTRGTNARAGAVVWPQVITFLSRCLQ